MKTDAERRAAIRRLRRERPRSRLVRVSVLAFVALAAYAWLGAEVDAGELFERRRWANLERFLTRDAVPHPLRDEGFSWAGLLRWAAALWREGGAAAALATFWISVLAIALAGAAATLLSLFGARTLCAREPYLPPRALSGPGARGWRLVCGAARGLCVLLRAIPEYVWAFLLLAMLGPSAWPIVLALALHNAGILGRLGSETIENLDRAPLAALRALGASRAQIAWTAIRPLALPRGLLYLFYRYETCVREATVLGMLGVGSLGYWIQEARARQRYDEMLFLILLGAALVIVGDVASQLARAWVRRAA